MLSFPTIAAVEMYASGGRPVVLHPLEELMAAAASAGFREYGLTGSRCATPSREASSRRGWLSWPSSSA